MSAAENHSREQPGKDHHKQRTTKIACDSKITPEMRHKIVTNNGHLPKCVTSGLKAFRIHSSQAKICLHSAPEARCTSFTLLFLSRRHVQGPHHGRRPRARRGGRFRRRQTPAKTGDDHRQYTSRQHAGVLRRPAQGHDGDAGSATTGTKGGGKDTIRVSQSTAGGLRRNGPRTSTNGTRNRRTSSRHRTDRAIPRSAGNGTRHGHRFTGKRNHERH